MKYSIRFVGGPWHNRIEEIELQPRVIIRQAQPVMSLSYGGCFSAAKVRQDMYYLAKYETTHGRTPYWQYVHSTLVRGSQAMPETYQEWFPKWLLDQRSLDVKIRRAMSSRA